MSLRGQRSTALPHAAPLGLGEYGEHPLELIGACCDDRFGLGDLARHRPDGDLAHGPDRLGKQLLAARQGLFEQGQKGIALGW